MEMTKETINQAIAIKKIIKEAIDQSYAEYNAIYNDGVENPFTIGFNEGVAWALEEVLEMYNKPKQEIKNHILMILNFLD